VITVGDCTITVSASPSTSLATADAMVQYEGMRIDEMDIELGDVITILRGDPMMYFGAFVNDNVVYLATRLTFACSRCTLQKACSGSMTRRRPRSSGVWTARRHSTLPCALALPLSPRISQALASCGC
jgi:hypothetical protein